MNVRETLREAGFEEAEVRKLLALRKRYRRAEVLEPFTEAEKRRLQFARWLVQHGKLSG